MDTPPPASDQTARFFDETDYCVRMFWKM